jgi:hypothetical protein
MGNVKMAASVLCAALVMSAPKHTELRQHELRMRRARGSREARQRVQWSRLREGVCKARCPGAAEHQQAASQPGAERGAHVDDICAFAWRSE